MVEFCYVSLRPKHEKPGSFTQFAFMGVVNECIHEQCDGGTSVSFAMRLRKLTLRNMSKNTHVTDREQV